MPAKECLSSGVDDFANKCKVKQAKSQSFFFYSLSLDCHQKVGPRFRVDLTSKDLIKKIPHRCTQLLEF